MHRLGLPIIIAAALVLGAPAGVRADSDRADPGDGILGQRTLDWEQAEQLAREGLAKLRESLDAVLQAIPRYDLPEILPNGDIIIRRRDREDGGWPEADVTDTNA